MAITVLAGVDDSDESVRAVRQGLAVLGGDRQVVLAHVIEPFDPMLVTGTGMAGGTMSTETFEATSAQQQAEGERVVAAAAATLDLPDADTRVVRGSAGPALCDLAQEVGADVVVIGTRGRGGLSRALLGSVSDHVVRTLTCPVLVTGPEVEPGDD